MKPLDKTLRNKLERTVRDARDIAETAAKAVLEQLGVGEAAPFAHLSEEEKILRRRLRVHGRQLGDSLNGGKVQTMDRLIEEVAYEHWHRMLFARFLAENNLLMYPDPDNPVAVSLEECEDLAADEGAKNGWELAARFAARMLPQIFRTDSPVFQLQFAADHQLPLEKLLADLPQEVFTASDSLGWVYQFWQAKKKDEVNASEVKIGARELPAVTQLFTEPYMVSFLLDNSLGAWWAARRLSGADLKNAKSEEELRAKAALPGVPLEYLRFIKKDDGTWTPAAGTFDGWPKNLRELKTLDPCCGSGHFLVAAFLMLVAMRMELERLTAKEAVGAVLRENIHGLEIDKRCVELAAFALALTAWRYPDAGGYRQLPELNVACSGLTISAKKQEWIALAGDNNNLCFALEELYKLFKEAPLLGSLISLEADFAKSTLFELKWTDIAPLLSKALSGQEDTEKTEMGVVAQGLSRVADYLTQKYQVIMTNVPYLARGKQDVKLCDFCEKHYPEAKNDLATVFLLRSIQLTDTDGVSNIVLPQNWLFLASYEKLRVILLKHYYWRLLVKLGSNAFETPLNVSPVLISIGNDKHPLHGVHPKGSFYGYDLSQLETAILKSDALKYVSESHIIQSEQLLNPDARVVLEELDNKTTLSSYVSSFLGLGTGDFDKYGRNFWEFAIKSELWSWYQSPPSMHGEMSGFSYVLAWDADIDRVRGMDKLHRDRIHNQDQSGQQAWKRRGILVSLGRNLFSTVYSGVPYDKSTAVLIPSSENLLPCILAYCVSDDFLNNVRKIDEKVIIANGTLVKVPFDLDHWTKVASEKYPNGLPKPYSDDPTQWIFHGHPAQNVDPLQVAIARLLGYRWPAELDNSMELSDEARALVKKSADLLSFADDDGIVCIPPVRGESSAADRLLNLLAAAYGNAWSNDKLLELLNQADHAGKTLETWLRDKFFLQHCKLFQHRPFIWHIWDGLRDGFAALVNYHKLDHKNLETLIYTYLGDWISRQRDDIKSGVDGAVEKLAAAEQLKKKLEQILEGEAPYDIFVRWKPIDKQPIGWNPDINDGVRLNVRPFMTAGVLRFNKKPQINITWDKDRGKDVESAPWFKVFKGDRINDHHLSLAEKREQRGRKM